MASSETLIDTQNEYTEADYSAVHAEYEYALQYQEAEEKRLSYLIKAKEGDEKALNFLIEESRENVSEIKKKIQTFEDIKKLATPLTAPELELLEGMKRQKKLTPYGESIVSSIIDKKLNGQRNCSDAWVRNGGCAIPSCKQTISGEQNTNDVQAFGDEAIHTQVLSTGAPPGCDGPRPKCLGVGGVMPPEGVFTDSRHRSPTSLTEESNTKVIVEELQDTQDRTSVPGRSQPDVDIKDNKVTKTKEKKIDQTETKNEKKKNNNKETKKKINKEKKKKSNKEKKMKAEKVKSTKVRRGFLSCFLCCFRSQERRDDENVKKETAV